MMTPANSFDALGQVVHIEDMNAAKKTDYSAEGGLFVAGITKDAVGTDTVTYLHNDHHNDHLGSTATGTNQNGGVLWTQRFTPYGEELNSVVANDNQAGFTGHIKDAATGLNYMQARYYDPVIGRFLSIDPVTFLQTGNPGMFNRYAYTENDPINFTDPTGMLRCSGSDQCDQVHKAASSAQDQISSAQDSLTDLSNGLASGGDLSSSQQATFDNIESNFGESSANSKTISKLSGKLSKLSKRIGTEGNGAKVYINKADNIGGKIASTDPLGGEINLFQDSFKVSQKQNGLDLSGVILHEGSHGSIFQGDTSHFPGVGEVYGRKAAAALAKTNPRRAARSVTNQACFVNSGNCGP